MEERQEILSEQIYKRQWTARFTSLNDPANQINPGVFTLEIDQETSIAISNRVILGNFDIKGDRLIVVMFERENFAYAMTTISIDGENMRHTFSRVQGEIFADRYEIYNTVKSLSVAGDEATEKIVLKAVETVSDWIKSEFKRFQ